MKKILYITMFAAGMFSMTSCNDYLETSSPSTVDANFVFSNMVTAHAAMDGGYEAWRDILQNGVFGDGLWYAADVAGFNAWIAQYRDCLPVEEAAVRCKK